MSSSARSMMSVSCSPETIRDLTSSRLPQPQSMKTSSIGSQQMASNSLMSVSCHPDMIKHSNSSKPHSNVQSKLSSQYSSDSIISSSTNTLVSEFTDSRHVIGSRTSSNSGFNQQCPDSPMSGCSTHTLTNGSEPVKEIRPKQVKVSAHEIAVPMPPLSLKSLPPSPASEKKQTSSCGVTTSTIATAPSPPPVHPRRTPSPKRHNESENNNVMSKSLISRLGLPGGQKRQSKGSDSSSPRNSSSPSPKFDTTAVPPNSSPKLFHKSEKTVNVPASLVLGPKHNRSSSPSFNSSRAPPPPPPPRSLSTSVTTSNSPTPPPR